MKLDGLLDRIIEKNNNVKSVDFSKDKFFYCENSKLWYRFIEQINEQNVLLMLINFDKNLVLIKKNINDKIFNNNHMHLPESFVKQMVRVYSRRVALFLLTFDYSEFNVNKLKEFKDKVNSSAFNRHFNSFEVNEAFECMHFSL